MKALYQCFGLSEGKRLKGLGAEIARTKNLLAESLLEQNVSRKALRKKC